MSGLLALGLLFVSGYTCDAAHGQPYCGLTADGSQVGPGVAACPRGMPFGTLLRVEGLGDVVCHDRGPEHIDVWVPTIADAYAITGYRQVSVVTE